MSFFEKESAVYDQMFPELLAKHEGKFAVIRGDRFLGVFDSNDEGYRAGLDAFGIVPFLLRHITRERRVIHMLGIRTALDRAQS